MSTLFYSFFKLSFMCMFLSAFDLCITLSCFKACCCFGSVQITACPDPLLFPIKKAGGGKKDMLPRQVLYFTFLPGTAYHNPCLLH